MNKSKFAAFLVSLAGLAATLPAAAQSSFYVGGSIGNSEIQEDACRGAQFGCDRSDTNWSGNVGMMFNPNWGVELAYRDFGKIVEQDNGDGTSANWKTKAGEIVIVGALPINKLIIYGKFGAYYAKTKLESNYLAEGESKNKQWTGGLGVGYDLFRHVRIRAEWQRYNNLGGNEVGIRGDVNVVSGGIVFIF